MKLKAEWRCESRTCTDIYKRVIYCALLGGDVPEVCNNLENWLWLKLYPCSLDPTPSPAVFKELQRLIAVDYGNFILNQWIYFNIIFACLLKDIALSNVVASG